MYYFIQYSKIPWNKYYSTQLTDEETRAQRLYNLHKVTRIVSGKPSAHYQVFLVPAFWSMFFPLHCLRIRIFSSLLIDSDGWSLADLMVFHQIVSIYSSGQFYGWNDYFAYNSELCSWRNFHPDAGVSFWIVITIKSSCSYLFLFAYVQKPQLFSQTKPFCKNAAEDTQMVLKKSLFVAFCWKESA